MMNAISPPVQAVLDLFTTELTAVRFGDVDANVLGRLAADTLAAAEAVAVAQAALDGARGALQERQDALHQQAQRALAYARVYAESDDALSMRLEAIALPKLARRARTEEALVLAPDTAPSAKRRGRPRKVEELAPARDAPLPEANESDESDTRADVAPAAE